MKIELIQEIKNIDKKAFKTVFNQLFKPLCAFGYKYITDVFIVEDIVQEVFIGFWDKRQDFDHINAVKAFLYTSVRNKCINHLKHQAVIQKHETKLIYELESDKIFKNSVIEEDTINQLIIEIKNLPKAAQEIMLLALNGLKNPEIAKELNISVNTVKTQKKIAYSKLKDRLSPFLHAVLLSF